MNESPVHSSNSILSNEISRKYLTVVVAIQRLTTASFSTLVAFLFLNCSKGPQLNLLLSCCLYRTMLLMLLLIVYVVIAVIVDSYDDIVVAWFGFGHKCCCSYHMLLLILLLCWRLIGSMRNNKSDGSILIEFPWRSAIINVHLLSYVLITTCQFPYFRICQPLVIWP